MKEKKRIEKSCLSRQLWQMEAQEGWVDTKPLFERGDRFLIPALHTWL